MMDLRRALNTPPSMIAWIVALLTVAGFTHAQSTTYTPYNAADVAWIGTLKFFAAADPVDGVELWRSDGTAAGTSLVSDIWPGASGSYPQSLATLYGRVF